jgi:hypothetical protein
MLRLCIAAAVLSLAIALYMFQRPSPSYGQRTNVLENVCILSMAPAIFLSVALLPADYRYIHCYDDGPPHQALIAGSVIVTMNVLFWTTLTAVGVLIVRSLKRGENATPRV